MRSNRETLILLVYFLSIICLSVFLFIKLEETPPNAYYFPGIFVTVLPTISALIFPSFFRNSQEGIDYARSDEKYVAGYLCMFILGITLALIGVINLTVFMFKISLIIFLDCLLFLPLYIFLFIRVDELRVMKRVKNSIFDELNYIPLIGKRINEEIIKERINDLARITLRALNNHNYVLLDFGIDYFKEINYEIMKRTDHKNIGIIERTLWSTKLDIKTVNLLTKEIMKIFCQLGILCIERKLDERSRKIGKHMSKVITYGIKNQKNIEYPNLVLCLEKLALAATRNHLEETTDEILNSLGQIGDQSIQNNNLQRSPILAVLKSLQNIGIACTEEKMTHQCATAKARLLGIAQIWDEPIRSEALKRLWVVISHIYTNIEEAEESNFEFENMLKKRFGNEFMTKIDDAIQMLHKEGEWIQKRTLKEFKNKSGFFN